jgi:hypothetical protein
LLVSAYSATAWHGFFQASVGASAALLGLLFVSMSINIQLILKYPNLPGRASATLGMMLTALVVGCFALAPNANSPAFGWEVIGVTAVAAVQSIWVTPHGRKPTDPLYWLLGSLATVLLPALTLMAGGISLLAGAGGGFYWILGGTAFCFVAASVNAWVLLVEVLR